MRSPSIDTIADEIAAARRDVRQIAPFGARYDDFDVARAYAVADRVHRDRVVAGGTAVGRKIGFTNPDMWARYGVDAPIWAHVYDDTVVALDGPGHVCSLAAFTEPKIEPEIVFRFRSTPPVDGGLAAIAAAVDWVCHGFEIVQSHYPGWRFAAADTIADNALHGRLLLGPQQPIGRLGADAVDRLERFVLTLSCDGADVEVARGSNVLGNPLNAIAHLVGVLARQPGARPIEAGELVTTGTVTAAWPVAAGQRWQTAIDGIDLPGLGVEFI